MLKKMRRATSLMVMAFILIAVANMGSVRADQAAVVVVSPGGTRSDFYLTIANTGEIGYNVAARANGTAAGWVTPTTIDFGQITPGQSKTASNAFTLTVPSNTTPANYTLDWTYYAYNGTVKEDLFVRGYIIEVVQSTGLGMPGFPLEAIALGAVLGLGLLFVMRRRPTV